MKDYYRILQVHNEAEVEVIEAAYRRLMRKYHPDVLPPELRNAPDVLQKAKDINEAFEVLSDSGKRAAYDKAKKSEHLNPEVAPRKKRNPKTTAKVYEKSFLYVRCSQTKEVFKAMLVREQGTSRSYTLIGFEPALDYSLPENRSILKKLSRPFSKNRSQSLTKTHNFLDTESLTDEDIHKRLNEPPNLTMGDINWGSHFCPSCAGSTQNANGTTATWIGCSKCGHIRCAGGVKETKVGKFSTCPWCGKTNQLTRSVKTGKKDHLKLHGIKKQNQASPEADKLEGNTTLNQLPDGDG